MLEAEAWVAIAFFLFLGVLGEYVGAVLEDASFHPGRTARDKPLPCP